MILRLLVIRTRLNAPRMPHIDALDPIAFLLVFPGRGRNGFRPQSTQSAAGSCRDLLLHRRHDLIPSAKHLDSQSTKNTRRKAGDSVNAVL